MNNDEIKRVTKRCIPGVTLQPRNGYYQVHKIGLSADRVKTDPAFSNTRQEARQFASISRIASLIGKAILPGTGINKIMPRLMAWLRGSIDTRNYPWYQTPASILWQHLQHFECNTLQPFQTTLDDVYIVQGGGQAEPTMISFRPFMPAKAIRPPLAVQHARLVATLATIENDTSKIEAIKRRSTLLPLKEVEVTVRPLILQASHKPGTLQVLTLGLEWYGRHNPNGMIVRSEHAASMAIIRAAYNYGI